nr:MAG TPA: hypothetical protein [Caudoviricetes sp.]
MYNLYIIYFLLKSSIYFLCINICNFSISVT